MEGWIIVNGSGKIIHESLETDRMKCIKEFVFTSYPSHNWKHYYNKGYRCKRVVLKFD